MLAGDPSISRSDSHAVDLHEAEISFFSSSFPLSHASRNCLPHLRISKTRPEVAAVAAPRSETAYRP
jgi:hypothetical protein